MVDPFAPPGEAPPRRRRSPPPAPAAPWPVDAPAAAQPGWTPPASASTPASAPLREDRPEPARPGIFWTVAAIGIGLVCLGRLLFFFIVIDDIDDEQVAPALFSVFGTVTLVVGLTLAGVLQRGLSIPWRIALLLGAGYFATQGDLGALAFFGGLF